MSSFQRQLRWVGVACMRAEATLDVDGKVQASARIWGRCRVRRWQGPGGEVSLQGSPSTAGQGPHLGLGFRAEWRRRGRE
jgi:hypothetical protein